MKKPNLTTSQRITENWLPINRRKKIIGRATVGAGDIMYLYNVAHLRSHVIQAPIDLVVHWYHPENYLHHFEDPETLPERAEYLLSFYANDTAEVNINHVFDSNNYSLYSKKFTHFKQHGEILKGGKRPSSIKTNDWHFRDLSLIHI